MYLFPSSVHLSARFFGQHQGTVPPRPNVPPENSVASTGLEQLSAAEMERRMKLLQENRWRDYLRHPHHVLFRHMVQTAFHFSREKALCIIVQMCMFCVWEKDADESSSYYTQEMANNIISYYLAFLNAVSIYRELQKLHMKFVIGKVLQESEFWATRKVILIDKLYIHKF